MEGKGKLLVALVVLAIAGGTGYYLFAGQQKREQQRTLTALVGDTTEQLRRALGAPPPPDMLARIESNLKLAKAPRDRAFEDAAEHYLIGAREIVRRRGDVERLTRESAMSRRALAMHMNAATHRDSYWIRVASDLQKRVERDHLDLERALRSLSDVLGMLPDAQKRLAPHVDPVLLLEDKERRDARDRAAEQAKQAAAALEKTRRLPGR